MRSSASVDGRRTVPQIPTSTPCEQRVGLPILILHASRISIADQSARMQTPSASARSVIQLARVKSKMAWRRRNHCKPTLRLLWSEQYNNSWYHSKGVGARVRRCRILSQTAPFQVLEVSWNVNMASRGETLGKRQWVRPRHYPLVQSHGLLESPHQIFPPLLVHYVVRPGRLNAHYWRKNIASLNSTLRIKRRFWRNAVP